jgi:hypothetical protein
MNFEFPALKLFGNACHLIEGQAIGERGKATVLAPFSVLSLAKSTPGRGWRLREPLTALAAAAKRRWAKAKAAGKKAL